MKKHTYTLLNGPFDGTTIEMPHEIDRIALRTSNALPGIEYVKRKPNGNLEFTIIDSFEAIYDEVGDDDVEIAFHNSEEDYERHEGFPLFYNKKASGIRS